MLNLEEYGVREMLEDDVALLCDYWLTLSSEELLSMGADKDKLPAREDLSTGIVAQLRIPLNKRSSFALVWTHKGYAIGHCNLNPAQFGGSSKFHLHIWSAEHRQKGVGLSLVAKSIPIFFERMKLTELLCEPYALNSAPNRLLKKLGFEFVKCYNTIPGSINFEQDVNQWKMTLEKFKNLNSKSLEV